MYGDIYSLSQALRQMQERVDEERGGPCAQLVSMYVENRGEPAGSGLAKWWAVAHYSDGSMQEWGPAEGRRVPL